MQRHMILSAAAIIALGLAACSEDSNEAPATNAVVSPDQFTQADSLRKATIWTPAKWRDAGVVLNEYGPVGAMTSASTRTKGGIRVLLDGNGRGFEIAEMTYNCDRGIGRVVSYYRADTDGSPETLNINARSTRRIEDAAQNGCTGKEMIEGTAMDALVNIRERHPPLPETKHGTSALAQPVTMPAR